jgi:hypothetical protein
VQLPAATVPDAGVDVDVVWQGTGAAPGATIVPFETAGTSAVSPEVVKTTVRTIQAAPGGGMLVEGPVQQQTLYTGREPTVMALFPEGFVAASGLLGEQATVAQAARPDSAGLAFFTEAAIGFGLSAMYDQPYAVNPASVVDPVVNFEGWLYDRCATFLTFHAHTGDARFLRHAFRSCSYYARQIELGGANAGIFKGKPEPDQKYSHVRGLYAYYVLTGDEAALTAATAMANMWEKDTLLVGPYRMGKLRGPDRLWTERLLGASLEGLIYGHRLTGEARFLTAFREMVTTAHRHITGDAAALATINPGVGPFPPQNCFIHSAEQHAEGAGTDPWCSGWMSELTVDGLLRYQEQTGDERVDEIFIRLTRFLRDVGAQYSTGDVEDDYFLKPKSCFTTANQRRLIPLYGAGLRADGTRYNAGQSDDSEHCADATALTAAGLRALKRTRTYDARPLAPFPSEGASFLQLHHELAACARRVFSGWSRPSRAPGSWTAKSLGAGVADPAGFITKNLIGYPDHPTTPQRKLSWWFNGSMLQFGLLAQAGVAIPALTPGQVQPAAGCPSP